MLADDISGAPLTTVVEKYCIINTNENIWKNLAKLLTTISKIVNSALKISIANIHPQKQDIYTGLDQLEVELFMTEWIIHLIIMEVFSFSKIVLFCHLLQYPCPQFSLSNWWTLMYVTFKQPGNIIRFYIDTVLLDGNEEMVVEICLILQVSRQQHWLKQGHAAAEPPKVASFGMLMAFFFNRIPL